MSTYRPAVTLGLLLVFGACADAVPTAPTCGAACDELDVSSRRGLLLAPQYVHRRDWARDGRFGHAEAMRAKRVLEERGFGEVKVVRVSGVEDVFDVLDAEPTHHYDFVGTVSHSGRGGPNFDDPTRTATVQVGWSWLGWDDDGDPIVSLVENGGHLPVDKNGGPDDLAALRLLTDRLARVTKPEGMIIFLGCNTGAPTVTPISQPVSSAFSGGTPWFIPDSFPSRRFPTYAHAVSALTDRLTLGSAVRMSLGRTAWALETIYFGNDDQGTRAVPRSFTAVAPVVAEIASLDGNHSYFEYEQTTDLLVMASDCDQAECGDPIPYDFGE